MRGEVRSANWEAEGKNGDECGLERGWRDNAGAGRAIGRESDRGRGRAGDGGDRRDWLQRRQVNESGASLREGMWRGLG
jgi:hypothetical protein